MNVEDRFFKKVHRSGDGGCWLWTGRKDAKGYGRIAFDGITGRAHRLSFKIFNGSLPLGKVICHSCDNPSCVNPAHLFVGTVSDNAVDSAQKHRNIMQTNPELNHQSAKTHCKRGHEYSGENLYTLKPEGRKGRRCRECMRENYEKYRDEGRYRKAAAII
jgi:hypothetical protein